MTLDMRTGKNLLDHELRGPAGAPVLVLGPSLGTTRDMWQPQAVAASARHRVLAYDHLGHGGSPVPPGPYTLATLGRAVLDLADALAVRRFDYAGVSLGGMVGMWLAAHAPDRVGRLALLCTSAYLPPADGWLDRAERVRAHGTGDVADTVVARWFTSEFDEWDRYVAMVAATPAEGYAACCEAIAAMDLRPVLGRITAPTLVVSGADDPSTPPEHGRLIAESIPGARFELVADAAHIANVERADEVTALLLSHLDPGEAHD